MNKVFIAYETMRNNALRLAHRIYHDGFMPDVIYISLRGGAYLGNIISEYFKLVRKDERPVYYAAVVVRSYTSIAQQEKIRVEGWTYSPEHLRSGDKILLVDDIFDSGSTINHLAEIILEKGIPRKDLKIAVHDYKYFHDRAGRLPIQPDYYCNKYDIYPNEPSPWIHYLSHELLGLTPDELEQYFYAQDPGLKNVLSVMDEDTSV
jgi:hypoxanthine phosphoribosyltransferase